MTETNLTPALSAEEWASKEYAYRAQGMAIDTVVEFDTDGITIDNGGDGVGGTSARFDALMAVANYHLPDTDPRKITWEDVAVLRDASVVFRVSDMEVAQDDRATAKLRALAAKLAALLPPR